MENIKSILQDYISIKIPRSITNVIYQMFNGIQAAFEQLEYRLNITKRERNILTAQYLTSLRHLSAQNGVEPVLKIPATGIVQMKINPKLFNRAGYPLFLTPYSVLTNKNNKLEYYYNSNKSLRITDNLIYIPIVEGKIKTISETISIEPDYIHRIYLNDLNIAEGSLLVSVNSIQFLEVKSFFDSEGLNNDKQFLLKYSNTPSTPFILYVKGLSQYDIVDINYRLTNGELGNIINDLHTFEIESFVDNQGVMVNPDATELTITNYNGFELGSNGTDANALRAAIGYNHGKTLLFDNTSYKNFIGKYSTLLLQNITNTGKTINNIYISKKQSINTSSDNKIQNISQYKQIITNTQYFVSNKEKQALSKIINEFEYCLTSHNLIDSKICKFGFQIIMQNKTDLDNYELDIRNILYIEFSKFLYIRNYILNIETIFESFMKEKNINFSYMIFNQIIEEDKIKNKTEIPTPYIIKHEEYLPILCGDFNICDSNFATYKLFTDVNIVLES